MGTIQFTVTSDTDEYVYKKDLFVRMQSYYVSGSVGYVWIYFEAHGSLANHDLVILTVEKGFMKQVIEDISKSLNNGAHTKIAIEEKGLYSKVTAMSRTPGA